MIDLIRCLAAWVMAVLPFRRPGRHTRAYLASPAAAAPRPSSVPAPARPVPVPWPPAPMDPVPPFEPLDGSEPDPVRPYVLEVERARARNRERAQQYRRRLALFLAADCGIDLDPHVVGAEGVA